MIGMCSLDIVDIFAKSPENEMFRHSRENGNPVFLANFQTLDTRFREYGDFL